MADDSFDIGQFEGTCSFVTSTAWSSRVASRPKGRRTYGRRGSDGVAIGASHKRRDAARSRVASLEKTRDGYLQATPVFENRGKKTGEELTSRVEDGVDYPENNHSSQVERDTNLLLTPPIGKRRTFTRSHTISVDSPNISRLTRPSQLVRSKSVQSVSNSHSSSRSSYSSRSLSMTSSTASFSPVEEGFDAENFNPNLFGKPSNFSLLENTSPKRSSIFDSGKKCHKKIKPTNHHHAFLKNDFTPIADGNGNKIELLASGSGDSFSDLARNCGQSSTSWATNSTGTCPSNCIDTKERNTHRRRMSSPTGSFCVLNTSPDEAMTENTEHTSSPTTSMESSTRKRGNCKSQYSDDESPISRSRSRILSPPATRMSEMSGFSASVDSKKYLFGSSLMDVSFHSTKTSIKIDRKITNITICDDDKNASLENSEDESDISFDSDDEMSMVSRRLNTVRSRDRPSPGVNVQLLDLENATADDIVKLTSSIEVEDIEFLSSSLQKSIIRQGGCLVAPPVNWDSKRRDAFFRWTTKSLGFTFRPGGGNFSYIQTTKTRGARLLDLLKTILKSSKPRDEGTAKQRISKHMTFDFSSTIKKESQPVSKPSRLFRLTPKDLTSNSLWQGSADYHTEDLTQCMGKLSMNTKTTPRNADKTEGNYIDDAFNCKSSKGCPPRPSFEHYANATDLNAHLHGTTPVPPRLSGRPPRLSLQSMSSRASVSTNIDSLSPFIMNTFVLTKPSHIKCDHNNDFVLTPSIGRQSFPWGSRPFDDRDWGSSEACENTVMKTVRYRLTQSRKEAGFTCVGHEFDDGSQFSTENSLSPASLSSPNEIDELDVSHTSLCLSEIDAHSSMRVNEVFESRDIKRRQTSFAKHNRVSLFASAVNPIDAFSQRRKSLFVPHSCVFSVGRSTLLKESAPEFFTQPSERTSEITNSRESPLDNSEILRTIFDFFDENELLLIVSLVSTKWSDLATHAHANLMLCSVACVTNVGEESIQIDEPTSKAMERSWNYLTTSFPWACFLSEGSYKKVYKVFNQSCQAEEAISVMDVNQIHSTGNMNVVGAELAVSVMLSSLVRRGICPNFIATRGVFSCRYEPPESTWGSSRNRQPLGNSFLSKKSKRRPREPKHQGYFQYIRMELCDEGDAEEFLKRQPDESITPLQARTLLFQISFALHAAAAKFSLKHYDVKLLNVFLQRIPKKNDDDGAIILRYGLGEHTFSLESSKEDAVIAKLADYGTANVDCATSGQHVTIAQFTTLENTPPEYLILGDQARQGHGHDWFGLGLIFLHLFTGHAPYEEILEEVKCPVNLKRELRRLWENEEESEYTVLRSIVLADVYKDEYGNIIEGEPDETLYDTLYKFLVLFGVPNDSSSFVNSKVMMAVKKALLSENRQRKSGRGRNRKTPSDVTEFINDRKKFSLSHGSNKYIALARTSLSSMNGGMDLLLSLVNFDPQLRASGLDVLNSTFMASLRENPNKNLSCCSNDTDEVYSFTAFSTQKERL